MKILFALLSLSTPVVPLSNINHINQIEKSVIDDGTIDLDSMILNDSEVNVFSIASKPYDFEQLAQKTMLAVKAANKNIPELQQVLISVIKNPDNWLIDGMPEQYPLEGSEDNVPVSFTYIGSDSQFTGMLNVNVRYFNESTHQSSNIADLLKTTDLGSLSNTTEALVIETLLDLNLGSGVHKGDLEIVTIDYKQAKIQTTATSKLTGYVVVNYKTEYTDTGSFISKELKVEAYNSSQHDSDSKRVKIVPTLGKEKFIEEFQEVHFTAKGHRDTNYYGYHEFNSDDFDVRDAKNVRENKEESHKGILNITSDKDVKTIYYSMHQYENEEMIYTHAESEWTKENGVDTLVLTFYANVQVYATAWNAEKAKAILQVNYEGIKFA